MDAHYLYKTAFAFYLEANDLTKTPDKIRSSLRDSVNLRAKQLNFKKVVLRVLEATDLDDPRYDVFVDMMKRMEVMYHQIGPKNFHPAFSRVLFGPYTRRTWEYLHQSSQVPDELGVKVMRRISWDLNELLNSNKIFKDFQEEEEGYIGNEGYEEDNP
jgi:hypothetical protein